MVSFISIQLINFYQKFISPYKGFCCAYRVDTGGASCSQYTKMVIKQHGLYKAFPLIKAQFKACESSVKKLEKKMYKRSNDSCSDTCFYRCSPPSCPPSGTGLSCDACS